MSMINDALRRAKAAQQQTPSASAPELQFRPVEPMPSQSRGRSWVWPAALTLATGSALLVVYLLGRPSPEVHFVRAITPASAPAVEPAAPTAAALTPTPSAAEPNPAARTPALPPSPAPPVEAAKTPDPAASTVATPSAASTETVEAARVAPPTAPTEPAPVPRLQAIIYNPTRPSAMIGGKALFLGDRLGDQRLVAITQDTATFVGGGHTNVLTLP